MKIPSAPELTPDQVASLVEAIETSWAGLSVLPPELESQRLEQLDFVLDAVRSLLTPSHPSHKTLDSMIADILAFVRKAREDGFSPLVLSADHPETLCVGFAAFYNIENGEERSRVCDIKLSALREAGAAYPHLATLGFFHSAAGRRGLAALLTSGVNVLDPAALASAGPVPVDATS